MSLKDLLPPGTYEEIAAEAHLDPNNEIEQSEQPQRGILVQCPTCHKVVPFDKSNPFRPFCSEQCKMLDLGEWANEERTIPGKSVDQDEDSDLLNDPNLPVRNLPQQD